MKTTPTIDAADRQVNDHLTRLLAMLLAADATAADYTENAPTHHLGPDREDDVSCVAEALVPLSWLLNFAIGQISNVLHPALVADAEALADTLPAAFARALRETPAPAPTPADTCEADRPEVVEALV